MFLAPSVCILLLMLPLSDSPTVRIPITEPMPMMMPSIVRRARILLANKLATASMIFSHRFIGGQSPSGR